MKLYLIAIISLTFSSCLFSQNIQQIKADQQNYFWGEGSGNTLKKADNEALSMLINQISTQVESRFELLKEESGNEYKEKFNSVIRTYSASTLKNTERIVTGEEPDAKVFRYIKRSELDKIFSERKNKIIEFAKNSEQALNELQIADALKYYYWALTLLKSHPDGNTIKYTGGELMATWLPAQINNIFSGVSVSMGELKKEQSYSTQILQINYKGTPVSNYDYSYWDGKNWSNIISAKDGIGFVEFEGTNPDIKEVKLRTEYIFEGEAAIDKELQDVMQKIEPVPFRNSNIIAKNSVKKEQTVSNKQAETKVDTRNNLPFITVTDKTLYLKSVDDLKKAIRSGNYESAKSLFTETGFEMFKQLVQYGKAKILADKELSFLKQGDDVMCRSIPLCFSFQNNNKQFVEDLVLNFNIDKKISSLSFALGEKAISDIATKTTWPEKVRTLVINFMENYKTAYALKRLDYIESIFSDDALIIIGTILKVQPNEMNKFKDNKIVKYNRYSKQEYIKNLKFAFKSTEFINLKFEDNEIKGGEIYGIQIKQNYASSNYSDAGYLFLLIDFNDTDKPSIHVRTWQPEKNPDGSIYGLSDFN